MSKQRTYTCLDCGKELSKKSYKRCRSCYSLVKTPNKTKIEWPKPHEMKEMVWETPTYILAKQLGVSDKAIEKFCKKHHIDKPPRGYWRKKEIIG